MTLDDPPRLEQLGRFLLRGLRIRRSQQLRRSNPRQSVATMAGDSKGLLHDRDARQGRLDMGYQMPERDVGWVRIVLNQNLNP